MENKMKTSDWIAKRIAKEVDTVFGVQGSSVVNIVDSFKKAGLKIIPMHHEQSAAMAADAYARFKGFGVCYATSGAGITNLVSGTACSYFDSVPVLAIGGQSPSKFLDRIDRQTGFQETDGVSLFKPITKVSRRYRRPEDLEHCISESKRARQGTTYLEVPDDVQRENVEVKNNVITKWMKDLRWDTFCFDNYKKPLLILGVGSRDMCFDIQMPFICTWGIKDKYINHKFYKGDFGIMGSPENNKLIKEADLVLMIGTKIDTHHAPDWNKFAPNAYKMAIGLEFPHRVEKVIECELNFNLRLQGADWCKASKNTTDLPMYNWIDRLSEQANENDIIIPDAGQNVSITFQRWRLKKGQRLFSAYNHSSMGYSLPAAIGATLATGRRVIVIIGDGALMMNLQDLQTISDLQLPINIFVINNGGYGMIRQTQADWPEFLEQNLACNFRIPDVLELANTFNLKYNHIAGLGLSSEPSICEVNFEDTKVVPKWKFGSEL